MSDTAKLIEAVARHATKMRGYDYQATPIPSVRVALDVAILADKTEDAIRALAAEVAALQTHSCSPDCIHDLEEQVSELEGERNRLNARVLELEAIRDEFDTRMCPDWKAATDHVQALIAERDRLREERDEARAAILSCGNNPAGFDWAVLHTLGRLREENERLEGVERDFRTLMERTRTDRDWWKTTSDQQAGCIRGLRSDLAALTAKLAEREWVSVGDRLPTEADGDPDKGRAFYRDGDKCIWIGFVKQPQHRATHWMRIPPLPAEPDHEAQGVEARAKGCPLSFKELRGMLASLTAERDRLLEENERLKQDVRVREASVESLMHEVGELRESLRGREKELTEATLLPLLLQSEITKLRKLASDLYAWEPIEAENFIDGAGRIQTWKGPRREMPTGYRETSNCSGVPPEDFRKLIGGAT